MAGMISYQASQVGDGVPAPSELWTPLYSSTTSLSIHGDTAGAPHSVQAAEKRPHFFNPPIREPILIRGQMLRAARHLLPERDRNMVLHVVALVAGSQLLWD